MAISFKTGVLILTCSLIFSSLHAQVSLTMQTGWAMRSKEPFIAPGINVQALGFVAGGNMLVNIKRDQPADFGFHIGYRYKFAEVGVGEYYSLYSLDKYDAFKNKWNNAILGAVHYNKWFLRYEYLRNESRFSIGVNQQL
jgi:hypothetical protein